jgi:hypothetical protein
MSAEIFPLMGYTSTGGLMRYFKSFTRDMTGPYSEFDYTPYLPKGKRPGKWLPKIEEVNECRSGYHFFRRGQWQEWLNSRIYEIEVDGKVHSFDCKLACGRIRLLRELNWNDWNARLFAADCAERVLPIFEREYTEDRKPMDAIYAARYAAKSATKYTIWYDDWRAARDAARSAVWSSTWYAAWDAAWSSTKSADWGTEWSATWGAAGDAARYAAWSSARYSAWSADRYAAWDAERYADWDAEWSATWCAAGDAERYATWGAAGEAAGNAEHKWQTRRLFEYLDGKR